MINKTIRPQATPIKIRRDSDSNLDVPLLGILGFLILVGLVMVSSTSLPLSESYSLPSLYYFWRQLFAVALGCFLLFSVLIIPLRYLEAVSTFLLFLHIFLLFLVVIPDIGHEVNGARRWLRIFGFSYQPSEWIKLVIILYVSSYIVRHKTQVANDFVGFVKPFLILAIICSLLVLEPDFGSTVVLSMTVLGMLFLAGVPLTRFIAWTFALSALLATVALTAPYRLTRLMSFTDPWSDPLNSGWQLTQALIAFGNGSWLGVGLGNSVQKLFYLPEVHTDFIFAILGEEFGVVGAALIIVLFTFLVWRLFKIGGEALNQDKIFAAYTSYGVGFLIGIQAFMNIGVNLGLLPTKGLPLPFLSYANNNLLVSCLAVGIVLRVAYENRTILSNSKAKKAKENS